MKRKYYVLSFLGLIVLLLIYGLTSFSGISGTLGLSSVVAAYGDKHRHRESDLDPKDPFPSVKDLDSFEIESILKKLERSPQSIVFCYIISGNPELLNELKQFPTNKTAVTTLALRSDSASERLFWAKKLQELDPLNGMGFVLASSNLAELGRESEALAALSKAAEQPSIQGNMQAVTNLLPDARSLFAESYLKKLTLDDLGMDRVTAVKSLFPKNYSKLLSEKSNEEILEISKTYLHVCDMVSEDKGISVVNDNVRRTSVDYACKAEKFRIISEVKQLGGAELVSSLSSLPISAILKDLLEDRKNANTSYYSLTPEEVNEIVDNAFQKK